MTALEDENKRRMRQYIAAWNDHDTEAIVDFLSEDNRQLSSEELRAICEEWFRAFPDLNHEIKELAADGDWVLGRAILRGTHRGNYLGVPPTETEINVVDHFSTRFEDGLIAEHHATADFYTLLKQLGVTLPPERTQSEDSKPVVRRYFEALNARDKEAFRDTLAEDFTYGEIEGPEEMVENDWKWLEAMDPTWDIQAMHADGNHVTTRVRATGRHRGEILGLEPTGESYDVTALTLSRVEDEKVTDWWAEWDFAGLLNQIGAIDSPAYND